MSQNSNLLWKAAVYLYNTTVETQLKMISAFQKTVLDRANFLKIVIQIVWFLFSFFFVSLSD